MQLLHITVLPGPRRSECALAMLVLELVLILLPNGSSGQEVLGQPGFTDPTLGATVPSEVRGLYRNGLEFLADQQRDDGSWASSSGFGSDSAGVCAICAMAFLSSGEDPNFGRYATQIRRSIRHIIEEQHDRSGLFEGNTYDLGFAMLALAEAYGAVDDELLWAGQEDNPNRRTIAEALERAVEASLIASSRKSLVAKSWYSTGSSPTAGIPDTSVAGSMLMGLLAARNAGIEVPDHTIDTAVSYLNSMTKKDGTVGYIGSPNSDYGNSIARSAIVALCLSVAKRRDLEAFGRSRNYIVNNLEKEYSTHVFYGRYYTAQALFQCDYSAWQTWNQRLILKLSQQAGTDGSIGNSQFGKSYSTAMSLLALALNYRVLPVYER